MTLLFTKLLLGPSMVVGVSLAARRWGPTLAGALVGLPIVAGPILLIVELQRGSRFGASSASAALLGVVALAVFAVVFAGSARLGWPVALVGGWVAYLAAAIALARPSVAMPIKVGFACAAVVVARRLIPRHSRSQPTPNTRPVWDLPARAVSTALLVLAVTGSATALGPKLTGTLAPFPIATSVVFAFALAQDGLGATRTVVAGFLEGIFGLIVFFLIIATLLNSIGTFGTFAIALSGAIAVQLLAQQLRGRRLASRPS